MEHPPLIQVLSGLAVATTFGGMTFFSAVMAPLVFTKLPFDAAAAFIRQVFPWYYLSMGLSTLVALLLLTLGLNDSSTSALQVGLTAGVLVGFVYARQLLMPRINRARDAQLAGVSDSAPRFQRLHRISVIINGVQWLAVLAVLVMVLA